MPKGETVNAMFSEVAPRYDRANHLLSGGVDYYWRNRLARNVAKCRPQELVDLATGSGDVAFVLRDHLGENVNLTGMDFCQPMLDLADEKKQTKASYADIPFRLGDCMNLPLETESIDVVTISFGVRNFEDRQRGLSEMRRVLRPGGSAFILEFSQPYPWFRPIYYIYLKAILPLLARIICGKREAYDYLAGSIEQFPSRQDLSEQILQAGFSSVEAIPLTFGIVAIHRAIK